MDISRIAKKIVSEFRVRDEDVPWSEVVKPYSDEELEERERAMTKKEENHTASNEKFYCQECGHAFKTLKAAERAAFDSGCPKCGGSDIDTEPPKKD